MAYLVGPGREATHGVEPHLRTNTHSEPHLVAGDSAIMAWHGDDELSLEAARRIARQLDEPMRKFGTVVRIAKKDEHGERVGEKDAHVWHCSLSLAEAEGVQSDELWARVAEDFVAEMGFTEDEELGRVGCRWVAVRHGQSAGGNDHVHVVVNLVREDGTAANVWWDQARAQTACNTLEKRYGLAVLESRESGIGSRGHKPAERAIAARQGQPEVARDMLARTVRGCAAAAGSEAEFVRRLRRAGVKVKPRYASGRDDVVAGYSVAQRPPDGEAVAWFGGGRLARDLSLPRLREHWPDSPTGASDAAAEWKAAGRGQRPVAPGREAAEQLDPGTQRELSSQLAQMRRAMRAVPPEDRAAWAHVAHETAGVFAAWSVATEPVPGPLAATAHVLARSAQLRAQQVQSKGTPRPSAHGVALVFAAAARGGKGPVADSVLVRQVGQTVAAVVAAHKAVGDAQRAAEITRVLRTQLAQVEQAAPMFAAGSPSRSAAAAGAQAPGSTADSPVRGEDPASEAARLAQAARAPREPGSPVPRAADPQVPQRPPVRLPQKPRQGRGR